MTTSYSRGSVLKCLFPYDTKPSLPGPQSHYCLFISDYAIAGKTYATVCYGTSRLDDDLIRSHKGCILSVPSQFIKGKMPGIVTHFIADHVALISLDDAWVYPYFQARLDFVREHLERDGRPGLEVGIRGRHQPPPREVRLPGGRPHRRDAAGVGAPRQG